METRNETLDCAVIGGGLAGLCLAIQLADKGFSVIVFEKNQYPFHKVCGEYISMESYDFLSRLGLSLESLQVPLINRLAISSEQGFLLEHDLALGGFGISRYTLDAALSRIASRKGVIIKENCRVNDVNTGESVSQLVTSSGSFRARIVCGSFGKYTPHFLHSNTSRSAANYIGVKYHIRTDLPANRIELHNFSGGYCGVSRVDQDQYCLCYLTTAKNLQDNRKDIRLMEENVLFKNPHLNRLFLNSEFVDRQPLVISNIQFGKKQTEAAGVFLLGDAAGSITPLCGNGMSMGMRASHLLAGELERYLLGRQSRQALAVNYRNAWDHAFGNRIRAGYYLQNLFGKRAATDLALRFLSKTPALLNQLVKLTHGQPF